MKIKTWFSIIFLLITSSLLLSCNKTEAGNLNIEIRINERKTESGSMIQIPEFVSENEEVQKNLHDLEKDTKELEKIVEKEEKKGADMEMRCYTGGTENYPQVTVIWYVDEEGSRLYNLMTLGADKQAGEPITCKEALEKTELTGVDLSLQVGKLVQESSVRGELQTTEMQGFKIGDQGQVEEIYMKVTTMIEEEEEEIIEEHFFSYVLEEDRLIKLSDLGFDVP